MVTRDAWAAAQARLQPQRRRAARVEPALSCRLLLKPCRWAAHAAFDPLPSSSSSSSASVCPVVGLSRDSISSSTSSSTPSSSEAAGAAAAPPGWCPTLPSSSSSSSPDARFAEGGGAAGKTSTAPLMKLSTSFVTGVLLPAGRSEVSRIHDCPGRSSGDCFSNWEPPPTQRRWLRSPETRYRTRCPTATFAVVGTRARSFTDTSTTGNGRTPPMFRAIL